MKGVGACSSAGWFCRSVGIRSCEDHAGSDWVMKKALWNEKGALGTGLFQWHQELPQSSALCWGGPLGRQDEDGGYNDVIQFLVSSVSSYIIDLNVTEGDGFTEW